MSIYHFGKAVENISASLRECPTIRGRVDHVSRRTTLKKLRALFPEFEDMRHSVAHAGELMEDADTAERHSIQGPLSHGRIEIGPGKVILRNCFTGSTGREFMNTFEGKIQTYEISSTTHAALTKIMNEFYSAF
jgi:hypothetical protein